MKNCNSYFLLLFFLLTSLHLNGAYNEYVPFEKNYPPLWAPENIRILDQSSDGGQDEIDFEFLDGNNKDRPYLLHTNIFTKGQGGREQQIFLWFDPTTDFHNYTLLWSQNQLVFFLDDTPIRVFKNTTTKGGSYPTKAMRIVATRWTSPWASHRVPVNWNDAPFEAHYQGLGLDACQNQNTSDQQEYRSSKL
ncbi:hypothetical protein JHK85_055273 [Glycine max]|nr:hypothetical protein JHK86_054316 [Glycine max]KAG4916816.1 hypothetical protein JHK87_054373 [Glycine soja]KAG4928787.1 hypothetical protein JHK85_055273 [Glycine max]RZB49333.1 Xyloglucan endotransglucosylase/hydrolase protein 2 [Glycine soja]